MPFSGPGRRGGRCFDMALEDSGAIFLLGMGRRAVRRRAFSICSRMSGVET